jgi:hypothetical protein
LDISVSYSGISIVVPAGIGAMLGSVYVPRLIKRGIRKKAIIDYALSAIACAVFVLAMGIPYLPLIYRVIVTPILIILAGFGFVGITIPTLTFLQSVTPDWLRGRVFGNLYFLVTIVTVIPVIFTGAITELFGIRTLLVIFTLICVSVLWYSKKRGDLMIRKEFNK